jgi:ABC-type branched-subunit amino acid transport system ATPase component
MSDEKIRLSYASRQYKALLYAKMIGNKGFTSSALAHCLAGLFRPQEKKVELSGRTITELQSKNLIERIGSLKDDNCKVIGLYRITPDGIVTMAETVAEYKVNLKREIGSKFTVLAQERLTACSNLGSPIDEKVLDAEEKVLEEIYAKFNERNKKKTAASTKNQKKKI